MKPVTDWKNRLISSLEHIKNPLFWKRNRNGLLITAGFIMALLLVHIFAISPVMEQVRELKNLIAQERQTVEKYKKRLAEAEQIKERLLKSQQELSAIREKLFPSNDPYQLATKLEEALSSGDKKDVVIKSYQIVSSRELGLYQEVQYSLSIDANIYGLSQFLIWLNNYASSVRLGEFNVRYAPRGGKESSTDLIINLTLTVLMQKKG